MKARCFSCRKEFIIATGYLATNPSRYVCDSCNEVVYDMNIRAFYEELGEL